MQRRKLSVGQIRGLASTSTPGGAFTILALDHRQSFLKMINPQDEASVKFGTVVEAKTQVVGSLGKHASAVLLDPIYGAAQAVASGACPGSLGLIVALEETGYTGTDTARKSSLLPGWSAGKARRMGADAVKLLVYYHPDTGELAEIQERFVSAVIDDCHRVDLPIFLEAVSYSPVVVIGKSSPEFARQLPDLISMIARRLGALQPEVLKLEFPVNPEFSPDQAAWRAACDKVSESAACPWAVLSGGVDFPVFARQVEAACRSGASGYIAGRAVWQDAIALPAERRAAWLAGEGARRLGELNEIAAQYATPWQSFFALQPEDIQEDWYLNYQE